MPSTPFTPPTRPKDGVARIDLPYPLPLPKTLQRTKVLGYDRIHQDEFAAIIKEILLLDGDTDLGKLHLTEKGVEETRRRGALERNGRLTGYNRLWYSRLKSDRTLLEKFQRCYQHFLRNVVARDLDLKQDETLIFQLWPTFRCHLPATSKEIGRRHRDYDYLHPATEINYWLPVGCDVFGSNSLYCESESDKGDFAPFTTKGCEVVRFYGNILEHFTTPNNTDTTRISVDMRIIRGREYWSETGELLNQGGHIGNIKSEVQFQIGRYYSTLRLDEDFEVGIEKAMAFGASSRADDGPDEESEDEATQDALTALFD